MEKTLADYWAPRINAQWQKSVEGIIGVGRQLMAAKEACEHGEFARLFKGDANAVEKPVPFSLNTAERLMRVARHPVLSNSAHVQTLPQSWGTLYELSQLDDDTLAAGIKAGEITPEMTRSQAAKLHADPIVNIRPIGPQAATATGVVRLPRWISAVASWADSGFYRFALGAVWVESDGFCATAVATDGRRMAVVTIPQSESMDVRLPCVAPFMIPADQLANAIKQALPRWKPGTRMADARGDGTEHFVTIEANSDGTATVASADGYGSAVNVTLCCDGRFPDWRAACDRLANEKPVESVNCNPDYLSDVSFLAKAANAGSISVRFTDSPSVIGDFETANGCKCRVLVMGMRQDDADRKRIFERQRVASAQHYAQGNDVVAIANDTTPKAFSQMAPTLRTTGKSACVCVPAG